MQAEWNVYRTAEMSEEQNLRNLCRQLEQQYVDWNRDATYQGYRLSIEWPYCGELGRYNANGVRLRFVTTRRRSIEVQRPDGTVVGEHAMVPGMAKELYADAGMIADLPEPADHCRPDGSPCRCADCSD